MRTANGGASRHLVHITALLRGDRLSASGHLQGCCSFEARPAIGRLPLRIRADGSRVRQVRINGPPWRVPPARQVGTDGARWALAGMP